MYFDVKQTKEKKIIDVWLGYIQASENIEILKMKLKAEQIIVIVTTRSVSCFISRKSKMRKIPHAFSQKILFLLRASSKKEAFALSTKWI